MTAHTQMEQTKEDRRVGAMNTMQAVTQYEYGGRSTLSIEELPIPEIGPEQVLLDVHAAGMDRGVWHLMTGLPYVVRLAGYGIRRPKSPVPGMDVSGRVVAVGADVSRFAVGDEVFGIGQGTFAEYAVADESKLAIRPPEIDAVSAGAITISGITALQAVTMVADVRPGQSVLVIGASGGVGNFALQIAKSRGAVVTGVARGSKADAVLASGADEVIDYTTTDYLDGSTRYDAIIDTGGRNSVRSLRKALAPNGTLVIVGGEGGGRWTGGFGRQLRAMALSPFIPQRLTTFVNTEHYELMEELARLIQSGDVTPMISDRFTLEQAATAMLALESGSIAGKAVIVVNGDADNA